MFVDFADAATVGAVSGRVIFDRETRDALGDLALSEEPAALMPATTFPSLASGDTIVITGRGTYTVREVRLLDDGALKRATLRNA